MIFRTIKLILPFLFILLGGNISRSQINKIQKIKELIFLVDSTSKLNSINSGTLSFFVSDAENGYGTPAEISFSKEKETIRLQTNDAGHLIFNEEEGKYTITISEKGHHPLSTYFIIEKGKTITANVILDRVNKTRVEYQKYEQPIVEGYVVDFETGRPLANAEVEMSTEKLIVKTNEEGFFSIIPTMFAAITKREDKGIRSDISVSLKNYTSKVIENILILPDRIKLKIVLKKGDGISSEKYVQHILDGTKEDIEMYEKIILPVNSSKIKNDADRPATGCIIPSTIRVGTSCSCTNCSSVDVMSLQYYSESGIDDEWISSWQFESLAAGSIPYRSYGGWYVNNPVNANFDIASSTCNQVWGSAVYTNAQSAAQATNGQIVTANGIDPARSEYSAENNQGGTSYNCSDCNAGGSGAYSCFSDNQCCGQTPAGHGRGMCQWGSQYWAQSGKNNQWIIDHYYISTIGYSICGGVTIAPTNLSVASSTCPQIGVTLNWNDSGANWFIDVSTDSNFTTYYNKSIANLSSITCPGGFCEYPNCGSYLQFTPGTTYYWRIWDGNVQTYGSSFTTPICSTMDTSCAGSIDDSGGISGVYSGNEDYTYTISPNNSSSVSLNFSNFDLELNFDSLYIYNGPSTSSPLIGAYTGVNSPGNVSSTGGSITLHFISDAFVNNSGFSATWACTSLPSGIDQLSNLSSIKIYPNPSSGDVNINYVLANSGIINVKLFNVLGSEISLLNNEFQPSGQHNIQIGIKELGISEGIYFIRFMSSEINEVTMKLIITP